MLATGSAARMLPGLKPDAKRILTNIEILDLREVPKSLAVLGAGAVGVEFASCFHRFGTKVQVFEMLPRIVPVEDEEVSKELLRLFKKQGIRVETGAKAENIQVTDNGVKFEVALADGKRETVETEALLVAVGRRPLTEDCRPARHESRTGSRIREGRLHAAHWRTRRLCDWRYRRWDAATGARRDGRGHGRDGAYRGQTGDADQ